MSDVRATLELLAARWGSAGPLLAGFPLIGRGRPVTVEEIAAVTGVAADQVEEAMVAARCERDHQGRLIDLFGLTLSPTLHRLEIDGKILFACCALWAHVVPKLVDRTVSIESVDPMRREAVRLTVSPLGIESSTPENAAATLTAATRAAIDRDVSAAFCTRVRHFVSRESAMEFAAGKRGCRATELAELQAGAEELYRLIWRAVDG